MSAYIQTSLHIKETGSALHRWSGNLTQIPSLLTPKRQHVYLCRYTPCAEPPPTATVTARLSTAVGPLPVMQSRYQAIVVPVRKMEGQSPLCSFRGHGHCRPYDFHPLLHLTIADPPLPL